MSQKGAAREGIQKVVKIHIIMSCDHYDLPASTYLLDHGCV
jgi:hypothetical protein